LASSLRGGQPRTISANGRTAVRSSRCIRDVVIEERKRQGRDPESSILATDSQSVKEEVFVGTETGIDGNKRVNGRKRHLVVDVLGISLAVGVSPIVTTVMKELNSSRY
jgi:hypothetical protein